MAYTPKSKYQFLQTSGNEYINPKTKSPYIGPYILTSGGAFIGNDLSVKNKIKLVPRHKSSRQNNIFVTLKTGEYSRLKPKVVEFIAKNNKYDYNLYTADSLIWAIDGDIIKANNTTLKLKSKKFPNISSLFVKLNEFQKVRTARKGELTYLDGKEYMGYYHIHLGKPMEGLFHPPKSHKKLLFVDKNTLYKKNPNLIPFYEQHGSETNQISVENNSTYTPSSMVQEQTTRVIPPTSLPSYTPPPPSTGGGSSGGGGGY